MGVERATWFTKSYDISNYTKHGRSYDGRKAWKKSWHINPLAAGRRARVFERRNSRLRTQQLVSRATVPEQSVSRGIVPNGLFQAKRNLRFGNAEPANNKVFFHQNSVCRTVENSSFSMLAWPDCCKPVVLRDSQSLPRMACYSSNSLTTACYFTPLPAMAVQHTIAV